MKDKERNEYILPVFIIVGCLLHIIFKILKRKNNEDFVDGVCIPLIRYSLKEFVVLFSRFLLGDSSVPRYKRYWDYYNYSSNHNIK